ncbi:MAG: hypothetical protein SOR40_07630 [Rothia sp. (in: high G+C Gram-positive bacteria)]|nr:hypothetical protein [Rothia sp. (in: high G+C Gram-positive bacteria)]
MSNVSRRTVAKGAAWATPLVLASTTIPTYAASQDICASTSPTSITWSRFTRTQPVAAYGSSSLTGSVLANNGSTTLSISHTSATGPALSNSQDMIPKGHVSSTVTWNTYSGMSDYLYFQHLGSGYNGYSGGSQNSTITISFSQPVTNFKFTIGDVDQASTWLDVLKVSGTLKGQPTTAAPTVSGGATHVTSGTQVTSTATLSSLPPAATSGNVQYTFAEPVDSITINWTNGSGRSGAQNIVLGATTFDVCQAAS